MNICSWTSSLSIDEFNCIKSSLTGPTKLRSSPLNFAYTGHYYYNSGSLLGETSFGRIWSRTTSGSLAAYNLFFGADEVNPQNTNLRGTGYPLRCTVK